MLELLSKSKTLREKVLNEEVKAFQKINEKCQNQMYKFEDCWSYSFNSEQNCLNTISELDEIDKMVKDFEESRDKKKEIIDKALEFFAQKEKERADREAKACVIDLTEDMYCGSLSLDVVSNYVCMLCYGIVMEPIQCQTCETLVCRKCVNQKQLNNNSLECFKKCGSHTFNKQLTGLEKTIYESLVFRCQNPDCVERIPLRKYRGHMLKHCKVQTFEYVDLPKGACSQFDAYGNEDDGDAVDQEDDWDFVIPGTEAAKNIYHGKFLVGDLNRLYLEDGEELDEEVKQWNEEAHIKYLEEHKNEVRRDDGDWGEGEGGGGGGWEEEEE